MANEFFQKGRINEKYQYALAKSLLERLELGVRIDIQLQPFQQRFGQRVLVFFVNASFLKEFIRHEDVVHHIHIGAPI